MFSNRKKFNYNAMLNKNKKFRFEMRALNLTKKNNGQRKRTDHIEWWICVDLVFLTGTILYYDLICQRLCNQQILKKKKKYQLIIAFRSAEIVEHLQKCNANSGSIEMKIANDSTSLQCDRFIYFYCLPLFCVCFLRH